MTDPTQQSHRPASAGLLSPATQRLVRTVDGLRSDDWRAPSGLPGWSRAHLIAHLTLNAEGLAGALAGLLAGTPTPMYVSQGARDRDIEDRAQADPEHLRAAFLGSTTELADALSAMTQDAWQERIERTPGGPTFAAGAVPGMRLREVEVHHVDLATGYSRLGWSTEFAAALVDAMTRRTAWREPFRAHARDLGREWDCGAASPVVSGTAADLGWWLTGRGAGDGLTSDDGDLPRIEEW